MAPLDAGALSPISDDQPAGDNLELDPAFGDLERAAQGKPEVQYGNTIEAAVPPDWKETAAIAQALLERTHDLRVLAHLAIARLHLDGFGGFASVIAAVRQELETRWQYVHPQLDPEDDNDPMQRSNALANLKHPIRVLKHMRELPLAGNPRKRRISWRDIAVTNGMIEAEAEADRLTESELLGAFADTEPAKIDELVTALTSLTENVPAIATVFDRNAGAATGPDFDPLVKLLRDVQRDIGRYRAATAAAEPDAEPAAEADAEGGVADPAARAARPAAAARGFASIQAIQSLTRREDAMHALDLAAGYFRMQEPSSPLPLLIERAKRLAGMSFMDILRDLAPDGLSQAQLVAGASNE